MRTITLHRYLINGRPSRYAMEEATALAKDPRAVPMQGTREVRVVPACVITAGAGHLVGNGAPGAQPDIEQQPGAA